MGARGLLKMVVALFALLFGAMALVGDGPEVAMGSDEPELTATEIAALDAEAGDEQPIETASKSDTSPTLIAAAQATPAVAPEPEARPAMILDASLSTTSEPAPAAAGGETSAADEAPANDQLFGIVLGTRVNVRSGPSTGNGVIGQVVEDEKVEILGYADNGWAEIRFDGRSGFISGSFVSALPGG